MSKILSFKVYFSTKQVPLTQSCYGSNNNIHYLLGIISKQVSTRGNFLAKYVLFYLGA